MSSSGRQVLVVDIGGGHVKLGVAGEASPRCASQQTVPGRLRAVVVASARRFGTIAWYISQKCIMIGANVARRRTLAGRSSRTAWADARRTRRPIRRI